MTVDLREINVTSKQASLQSQNAPIFLSDYLVLNGRTLNTININHNQGLHDVTTKAQIIFFDNFYYSKIDRNHLSKIKIME